MLGAAMLARTAKHTGNREYLEVARSAMEYSCSRQLADGSWRYGEDPKYHWIDNFHTGYNLDSLKCYIEEHRATIRGVRKSSERIWTSTRRISLRRTAVRSTITTAATRWTASALPSPSNRSPPFPADDPECLDLAVKVARWTIENMQGGTVISFTAFIR